MWLAGDDVDLALVLRSVKVHQGLLSARGLLGQMALKAVVMWVRRQVRDATTCFHGAKASKHRQWQRRRRRHNHRHRKQQRQESRECARERTYCHQP